MKESHRGLSFNFLVKGLEASGDEGALNEVHFNKGENIFKQGSPLTHLVIIKKGLVKVVFEYAGKSLALLPVKEGQMIGSPGFLTDNKHHFTVTAMEEVTVDFISVEAYLKLLETSAAFAVQAIRYLNRIHTITYKRLVSLTLKSMYGRVADTLLLLSDTLYDSPVFEISFSRQDLADFSALSKESTVRVLSAFHQDGLIRMDGRKFEILDPEKLKQIE